MVISAHVGQANGADLTSCHILSHPSFLSLLVCVCVYRGVMRVQRPPMKGGKVKVLPVVDAVVGGEVEAAEVVVDEEEVAAVVVVRQEVKVGVSRRKEGRGEGVTGTGSGTLNYYCHCVCFWKLYGLREGRKDGSLFMSVVSSGRVGRWCFRHFETDSYYLKG